MKANSVKYSVEIDKKDKKLTLVSADPHKLTQVFRNFVTNAIKFTPTGGTISVKVSIQDDFSQDNIHRPKDLKKPSNGVVRVEVRDSGHGIAKVIILSFDFHLKIRINLFNSF